MIGEALRDVEASDGNGIFDWAKITSNSAFLLLGHPTFRLSNLFGVRCGINCDFISRPLICGMSARNEAAELARTRSYEDGGVLGMYNFNHMW